MKKSKLFLIRYFLLSLFLVFVNQSAQGRSGDINGDSQVDLSDTIKILQIAVGLKPELPTGFDASEKDINGDGVIGLAEAVHTLQIVAGIQASVIPSSIISDDFYAANLNSSLWTWVDPVGDATLTLTGTQVTFSVPAGTAHDVWTSGNMAPRIMQLVDDTDFEIEIKFESSVTKAYQLQGLIIQQDDKNFLRFDFFSKGSGTRLFAASFTAGSPSTKNDIPLSFSDFPLYMRITREGDQFTQTYSENGSTWSAGAAFSFPLSVKSVGIFAGNAGSSPPEHTAVIDYFFNTASPIDPEDGGTAPRDFVLNVNTVGSGTVSADPDSEKYPIGQVVKLTAVPNSGYTFSAWSGDASGSDNPLNILMNSDKTITATFVESSGKLLTIEKTGSGDVALDPPGGIYDENTVVTLTATPAAGWVFDSWGVAISGTVNPTTVTMDSDKTISATFTPINSDGAIIDVWYGTEQTFGAIGIPQKWVNILGNVSHAAGIESITSLTYTLNGGSENLLTIGPKRRLVSEGDFNVEIAYTDLLEGPNQVIIKAIDSTSRITTQAVIVNYIKGNTWPENYTVDWSTKSAIQDAAQIVDGMWTIEDDQVKLEKLGYDRCIAIGDVSWAAYEVTVPITIHGYDPIGFDGVNAAPSVGYMLRWPGHSPDGNQPSMGYRPVGGGPWATVDEYDRIRVMITDFDPNTQVIDPFKRNILLNVTYWWKTRVENIPDTGSRYSFKMWQENQTEPEDWEIVRVEAVDDSPQGSLLLIAHWIDATFGNVTITPVTDSYLFNNTPCE